MIGARRMAFPRIEALTFWLLMAAGAILTTTIFFGGFPTGWTGYAPLQTQANPGMDNYILFFALVGISMTLLGLNMIATILTMRAPGLTWTRLPIFVWGVLSTAVLMVLAAPVLIAVLAMGALDRTAQTTFFNPRLPAAAATSTRTCSGSSATPRCTSSPCRASRSSSSCCPCSRASRSGATGSRSPGLLGVSLLSWFVWQHHLFVSGINGDLRPFYMLSTELISIPTGFTFLCGMMTLWRGHIRFTVPMLFCLAWFFNFLIGGLSGVFLSDTPSDVTTHGSFFSMAHFHYTIMGGLVFTFFAAIYYWVPKMTGWELNERLGKIHFWTMFIFFNSTFAPLFAAGFLGQPRRVVTIRATSSSSTTGSRSRRSCLGISMLVFLFNLVWSLAFVKKPAEANPWGSRSIEFQLPSPVPVHNFDRIPVFSSDPYGYGEGPVPSLAAGRSAGREGVTMAEPLAYEGTGYEVVEEEPPELLGRNLVSASYLLAGATAFFFVAFLFAYFYLRSLEQRRDVEADGRGRLDRLGHSRRRVLRR